MTDWLTDPCHNPDFCKLCRAADRAARRRNAHDDPKLERLRRLLDDDVSLERAYVVLNEGAEAPAVTVEALMYSLRERGIKALAESDTKRRLAALSDEQAVEVGNRLLKPKPETARAWSAEEIKVLFKARVA